MAEQGAIDSTTGINALLMGMQSKFQGGMEAMSKTIPGLMSTINDNVSMVMVEIGDSIAKNLNLVEKLQGVADWLSQFGAAVKARWIERSVARHDSAGSHRFHVCPVWRIIRRSYTRVSGFWYSGLTKLALNYHLLQLVPRWVY